MDDVSCLADRSKEQSYLFVVDSSQRDASAWPTPSAYEIAFAAPFRNVVGIDLLDASIPRTEFTVEAGRNDLVYALDAPASATDVDRVYGLRRRAVVTPGDYNLPQFIVKLQDALAAPLQLRAETDWVPVSNTAEETLSIASLTVPAEESNRVRLTCTRPFTVFAAKSGIRPILGLANPITTADTLLRGNTMYDPGSDAAFFGTVPGWSSTTPNDNDVFVSLARTSPDAEPMLVGPLPVMDSLALGANVAARQYFTATVTGPPRAASAYLTAGATATARVFPVVAGNVAGNALCSCALVGGGTETPVPREPATGSFLSANVLTAGQTYCVELSSGVSCGVYHAQSNMTDAGDVRRVVDGVETTVLAGEDLCVDVSVARADYSLVPPGLVNLSGERYVTVRSPEIDAHMFRDRASEQYHAGFGMVKMPGYGYRDQRYDFVSFPRRTFHPIGRLSRFTVRLEKPGGELYNAHGIDHTLTLVVRYMVPGNECPKNDKQLNPRYDSDMARYLLDNNRY